MHLLLTLLIGCAPPVSELAGRTPPSPADSGTETVAPLDNVLIVLIDDVGVDNVGVYGRSDSAPLTPSLDALAAEGVRFDNAYAYPTCSPTRGAILTGRYGRRHGLGNVIHPHKTTRQMRVSEVTIPRMLGLAATPWSTAALGKWHLAGFHSNDGLNHPNVLGFDHYRGNFGNLQDQMTDNGGQRVGYDY